jgi:hypothetical protein
LFNPDHKVFNLDRKVFALELVLPDQALLALIISVMQASLGKVEVQMPEELEEEGTILEEVEMEAEVDKVLMTNQIYQIHHLFVYHDVNQTKKN